jgi:protein phosphatase
VTALVDLALEAGAPDNVTAVVADVVDADGDEVAREAALSTPVVVGAAGERRNRDALPGLQFPDDVLPDGDQAPGPAPGPDVQQTPGAPEADRPGPAPDGSIGAAVESGEIPVGARATAPGVQVAELELAPGGSGDGQAEDASGGATAAGPGFVRRHAGALAAGAVVAAGLLIGILGFAWWLGSQWYVGVQAGYVTVFQGIPQGLVGVPLSRPTAQTALVAATLPAYDQQQLALTIEAATEADATRIVADLEAKAAACAAVPTPLGCPASTDPRTGGATATPSASPVAATPVAAP